MATARQIAAARRNIKKAIAANRRGGSHRRNPSKGTYCAKCRMHHRSAATARRAHSR